jgi:hypothetical protein
VTVHETDFSMGDTGARSIVHFDFSGIYTGPTGRTFANETHQNGFFTPDVSSSSGRGVFLRGAGGVLLMDTGHLVFEPAGTTIRASAEVLRFDDPTAAARVEATLCAVVG